MIIDTELTLDMMHVQLRWLEREMSALRQLVDQARISTAVETFEALEGVWQDSIFAEEDFDASRLTAPEDL